MVNIEEALMEVRPYVEYYSKLREIALKLSKEAKNLEDLINLLEKEEERAEEPFKTDIRILINHLRAVPPRT
ncbi:hypothetical protein [Pyrococcus sp. ST04]|uniref:hypothetical protein n=1 Tax=Pyrococcus sp. ST04 TaxID=1183377 RepID=UPI000260593F|nr:hypothetical protein [Pyrococcus sp. ST04]AFK21744.1 hypothetical protein Py04_0139 [Pyrococcus sp. ST04]